ncbi:MAG: glycosyltransferase WbuB, partial [Chitinophagaceae bacterium]|nr:glycosyltransferase WbuB [Chitinophagaceae bacterium]
MAKKGRNVTLVSSRASHPSYNDKLPDMGLSNYYAYNCENIKGVMVNGAQIEYGFNVKRIWSWLVFELRLLFWGYFQAKEKPDAVIVSSLSILTFLSGIILKRKYKCSLIVEVRDIWPLTIIESKKWKSTNLFIKFLSFVEKAGYRNADAIVGSMPNLREHVKNVLPESADKVFYVPMGYDQEFIYESQSDAAHAEFF